MSRRTLRPDELELWRRVARTTDRLHSSEPEPEKPSLLQGKTQKQSPQKEPLVPFEIGHKVNGKSVKHDVLPGLPEQLSSKTVKMDKKAYDRLKRGKLKPEARIDLHGMTIDQARAALTAFVMTSVARNRRLVLVITGKGKQAEDLGPIPTRPGVLRHNVPHWLQTPPLAQMVLQVAEAHARHGGGGAYYIYLRRRR